MACSSREWLNSPDVVGGTMSGDSFTVLLVHGGSGGAPDGLARLLTNLPSGRFGPVVVASRVGGAGGLGGCALAAGVVRVRPRGCPALPC